MALVTRRGKTAFTSKTAKLTFQIKGGGSITAPESTMTGELTEGQTLGLLTLTMTKSTMAALPINSLGDASGVVLAHIETHNCMIKAGDRGILAKLLTLHLEVPATKLLLTLEGSFIVLVSGGKGKAFTLLVEQKEGKQTIEQCEGGSANTVSTSTDGGAFTQTGLEAKEGSLTFTSVEQEAMEGVESEVLWRWLPGAEKSAFTGKSGKTTLQVKGGLGITAASSSLTGEITENQTLALALITLEKATTAGLPINSLGDAGGIILVHAELHNCLIKAGDRGILVKVLPLHLEVPSTKLLITLEGSYIALVSGSKGKMFTLTIEQKEGKQTIEKCEGGVGDTLLTSSDGGAFVQTGAEAKEASIIFTAVEQELMEN